MSTPVEFAAVVLALAIPIVAILMTFISEIKKKQHDTELRLALIQQGTDAETAKVLIEQQAKKKGDKYGSLRGGCILIGIGLGALCNALLEISPRNNFYFWLVIAAGMGIGLLTSFFVEQKKEPQEES